MGSLVKWFTSNRKTISRARYNYLFTGRPAGGSPGRVGRFVCLSTLSGDLELGRSRFSYRLELSESEEKKCTD